ncbi:MAG: hypothetical protein PHE79_05445 [Eubacteriales bacterium]|jgi:hypothetical protein|nr:hypothetical protein [Eubacteriales bacterium]
MKLKTKKPPPHGQMNLINRMRRLWMQLALWRRAYLISSAADFGDLALVGDRLYVNDIIELPNSDRDFSPLLVY